MPDFLVQHWAASLFPDGTDDVTLATAVDHARTIHELTATHRGINALAGQVPGTPTLNAHYGATLETPDSSTVRLARALGSLGLFLAYGSSTSYTGPPGGPNEFIVPAVTVPSPSNIAAGVFQLFTTIAPAGGPFKTSYAGNLAASRVDSGTIWGQAATLAKTVDFFSLDLIAIQITRGSSVGIARPSYQLIDFVGSNWTVEQIGVAVSAGETPTLGTLSVATGPWANKFIVRTSTPSAGGEVTRIGGVAYPDPGGDPTKLYVWQNHAQARTHNVYVIQNPEMKVQHLDSIGGGQAQIPAVAGSQTHFVGLPETVAMDRTRVIGQTALRIAAPAGTKEEAFFLYRLFSPSAIEFYRPNGANHAAHWSAQAVSLPGTPDPGLHAALYGRRARAHNLRR